MARKVSNVTLEGVEVLPGKFKNFSGVVDEYNPKGLSQFNVKLDFETADELLAEGWNVKQLDPLEEGDDPVPYLPLTINFSNIPPTVYMLTGRNNKKTLLTEDTIGLLDSVEIDYADIIVSPYHWQIKKKDGIDSGIKAYVKTMYVKVIEDELAKKYADDDDFPDEVPFN